MSDTKERKALRCPFDPELECEDCRLYQKRLGGRYSCSFLILADRLMMLYIKGDSNP